MEIKYYSSKEGKFMKDTKSKYDQGSGTCVILKGNEQGIKVNHKDE